MHCSKNQDLVVHLIYGCKTNDSKFRLNFHHQFHFVTPKKHNFTFYCYLLVYPHNVCQRCDPLLNKNQLESIFNTKGLVHISHNVVTHQTV